MNKPSLKYGENKEYVKIIGSTLYDEYEGYIGKIYEVIHKNYGNEVLSVKDENNEWRAFKFSDVQEATPLSFENERICISDKVEICSVDYKLCTIYGYYWSDGEWFITGVSKDDYGNDCYEITSSDITNHIPLHPTKKEEYTKSEIQKLKYELQKLIDEKCEELYSKDIKPIK